MYLLVVYDISCDKRRLLVDKTLSTYGNRVNYSVFEVEVSKAKFKNLVAALEEASDSKEDHIRLYVLNKESLSKSFVLHSHEEIFDYESLYI